MASVFFRDNRHPESNRRISITRQGNNVVVATWSKREIENGVQFDLREHFALKTDDVLKALGLTAAPLDVD